MHRGVQTTRWSRQERLLIAVAMLGLLFMPVEYRAGAEHPHAHGLFQLFAEASHGAPLHHQAPEYSKGHRAQDQVDHRDESLHELEVRSMTSSGGVMSPLSIPESSPGQSPANQGVNALWPGTTVPTELPPAGLMMIEAPDVPTTPELSPTVVTHTAALTGVLIVAFALLLVRSVLLLSNPLVLAGNLPQPEPPPPRLLTMLYT